VCQNVINVYFRKLLALLPDKGVKVQRLVETLRELIANKQALDDGGQNAGSVSRKPPPNQPRTPANSEKTNNAADDLAAVLCEPASTEKQIVAMAEDSELEAADDLKSSVNITEDKDMSESLSERLGNVHLSESRSRSSDTNSETTHVHFPNSYENVMRKHAAEEPKKERFKPNRYSSTT
jgi:hypothetical protein